MAASRQRVNDLEQQVTQLSELQQKSDKAVAELTKKLEKQRLENCSATSSTSEMKRKLDDLQERMLAKESECSTMVAENNSLRNELAMTKAYVEQIRSSASEEDVSKTQKMMKQLEELSNEKLEVERKLRGVAEQIEVLKNERDNIKRRHQTDVQELREKLQESESKITSSIDNADVLVQRNTELSKRVAELEQALAEAMAKQNESNVNQMLAKSENENAELLKQKDIQLANLTQQLSTAKRDVEEMVTKNVVLHQAIVDKDTSMEALRGRVQELEKAAADNRSVLANVEDVKTALSRALGQNAKVKAEFEELEQAFVKVTNEKMEMVEKIQHLEKQHIQQQQLQQQQQQQLQQQQQQPVAKSMTETSTETERSETSEEDVHSICKAQVRNLQGQLTQLRQQTVVSHEGCEKTIMELKNQLAEWHEHHRNLNGDTSKQHFERQESEVQTEKSFIETNGTSENGSTSFAERSEEMETLQEALSSLENRFSNVMREKAELLDEKERLEHTVVQLQSETDTIGEYIMLYQQQRKTLKQQEEHQEKCAKRIEEDQRLMKAKLAQLQKLVLKMVAARSQEPVRLLSTGPDHNPESRSPTKLSVSNENEVEEGKERFFVFFYKL